MADNETDGVTFSAPTDNNGNTWAITVQTGNLACGVSCIAQAQNVNAGNTTVTLSPSSGSKTYRFKVLEISGSVISGSPDVTSSIIEGANTTSHVSAADTSHINPSGPCFVICVGSTSNTPGTKTPGSGYTTIASTLAFGHWQYQIFTAAPTNEQGLVEQQRRQKRRGDRRLQGRVGDRRRLEKHRPRRPHGQQRRAQWRNGGVRNSSQSGRKGQRGRRVMHAVAKGNPRMEDGRWRIEKDSASGGVLPILYPRSSILAVQRLPV